MKSISLVLVILVFIIFLGVCSIIVKSNKIARIISWCSNGRRAATMIHEKLLGGG
jgi:hypothetical protein